MRIFCSWQILVLPNLRRVGVFQISAMANLEIRFQAPLTRTGIKLDKITMGCVCVWGGRGEIKKITPGLKVRFENALSNGRTFDCTTNDEKQKALMVEGMKLVIWNHQELKSN